MFGKLFAQTFTGSMYGAGPTRFAVWAYVIASKNLSTSMVEVNPLVLADLIGTDPASIEDAIAYLTAPDPMSRTGTEDGRRMVHEGGFLYRVVNAPIYNAIRNEQERREYMREAKRRQRKRESESEAPE